MTALPVEFAQGTPTPDPQDAWPVSDSGEREYTHVCTTVTASGPTVLYTPAPGKRVRVHWIYAVNAPTSPDSPLMSIIIGSTEFFRVYVLAKRQQFTGGVDEELGIILDSTGAVAVTVILEEV